MKKETLKIIKECLIITAIIMIPTLILLQSPTVLTAMSGVKGEVSRHWDFLTKCAITAGGLMMSLGVIKYNERKRSRSLTDANECSI